MTNVKANILVLAVLSLGLLCPIVAADPGERAPTQEANAASDPSEVGVGPGLGPPDPNGCRPYCR